MNRGWNVVYLLMVMATGMMSTLNGYGLRSWQSWVYLGIVTLTYIAGRRS